MAIIFVVRAPIILLYNTFALGDKNGEWQSDKEI